MLAGGVLTGKYLKEPAAIDMFQAGKKEAALKRFREPRGRMDENGWGQTYLSTRDARTPVVGRTPDRSPLDRLPSRRRLYRYRSGPADEATRAYARLAQQSGMSLTELSLRWARQRAAVTK